jgi:hypothetical protein
MAGTALVLATTEAGALETQRIPEHVEQQRDPLVLAACARVLARTTASDATHPLRSLATAMHPASWP